ncbi:MAG TPA: zf-TFIIB domain-containing protein [Methylomirabilota bacterium]|jgi:Zn-finger nucleic acid-binding protein|nr:zf-TFIIB domain-containing protein [Methylomirabilota bacterium]
MDDELDSIVNSSVATPTQRLCPKCDGTKLLAVRFATTNVVIDWCPDCQGLRLDRGEFERIVAHLRAKLDRLTSAEMRADLIKEVKEIWSGPEDTPSELLDSIATVSALVNITIFEHPALFKHLVDFYRTGRMLGL